MQAPKKVVPRGHISVDQGYPWQEFTRWGPNFLVGPVRAAHVWRQLHMATVVVNRGSTPEGSDWLRRYPPLLSVGVALLLALAVLPSALNLPQSNPSTTLEFAPIPPEDDTPPPPEGANFDSLGLASTGGLGGGDGGDVAGGPGGEGAAAPPELPALPEPGAPLAGAGKSPRTKRCVGNPPKQTDDPFSPPCVADFSGDNFGATYQGVTKEEVKILYYYQGGYTAILGCENPNQPQPQGYFDLAEPAKPGEYCAIRVLRTWQQYFNDRYQTYGRFVHFYMYFSQIGRSAEERKADAADNYNRIKPFAVLSNADTFADVYLEAMARRGVLNFGSFFAREASFFQKYPGFIWGYLPSLEIQADTYADYVCTKVVPHPVSFSKNAADDKKKRVFGLWRTRDKTRPELLKLAEIVKRKLEACGIEFVVDRQFPSAGWVADSRYPPRYAAEAVAEYREKGVTTIIWPGGLETNLSKQAGAVAYFPEVVALGDGELEALSTSGYQDKNFWNQVRATTVPPRAGPVRESQCYKSFYEADPQADDFEARADGCDMYQDLRQLFIGIQVAGPKLSPATVDKGFHAIPAIPSPNPGVPACFYRPGDYTCVKDAFVEHFDQTANNGDGCFRMTEGAKRYFAGVWPPGNVTDQERPDDPCNSYTVGVKVTTQPPDPEDQ